MTCPSEIRYGSFLVYSPRGSGETSRKSQAVIRSIKQDKENLIERAVKSLARRLPETPLAALFGTYETLVPVPRSTPLVEGALWPAMRICEELQKVGLASRIIPCLERVKRIPSSHGSPPGSRPDLRLHLESLRGLPALERPQGILLVDDVITKGTTLLSAAAVVSSLFPSVPLAAFALVRTMGRVDDIGEIVAPWVNRIVVLGDEGERDL